MYIYIYLHIYICTQAILAPGLKVQGLGFRSPRVAFFFFVGCAMDAVTSCDFSSSSEHMWKSSPSKSRRRRERLRRTAILKSKSMSQHLVSAIWWGENYYAYESDGVFEFQMQEAAQFDNVVGYLTADHVECSNAVGLLARQTLKDVCVADALKTPVTPTVPECLVCSGAEDEAQTECETAEKDDKKREEEQAEEKENDDVDEAFAFNSYVMRANDVDEAFA